MKKWCLGVSSGELHSDIPSYLNLSECIPNCPNLWKKLGVKHLLGIQRLTWENQIIRIPFAYD